MNIKLAKLAGMLTLLPLAACQQYLDRSEGVTSFAGNQLAANEAKMVDDPWPRYAEETHIHHDGQRLSGAVTKYRSANSTKSSTPASGAASTTGGSGGNQAQNY